jgi:hypothetical protein
MFGAGRAYAAVYAGHPELLELPVLSGGRATLSRPPNSGTSARSVRRWPAVPPGFQPDGGGHGPMEPAVTYVAPR